MIHRLVLPLLALALPAPVLAQTLVQTTSVGQAQTRAEVDLLCEVELDSGGALDPLSPRVGLTREFCNSGRGYVLLARATGDLSGASLIVDGRRVGITPGQAVELARESGAARAARVLEFDAGDSQGPGTLSLWVEAL